MINTSNTVRDLFLLDDAITYLNCANMSPVLKAVKQASIESMNTRSAPWNLTGADWFTNGDMLRALVASIIHTSEDNMALIPSASYGLAAAAKNLHPAKGKEIIVLEQQFPSNYYVWQKKAVDEGLQLVTVKRTAGRSLTAGILDCITANTGIITIPNCHWIDGEWIDLQQVSTAARAAGAYLVLDLSQSMGVLPIEIDTIQPDFAVSVGYKWLLGPYGLGYMYVSPEWQEKGEPLEYSWLTRKDSDDFSKLDYVEGYRQGARKFDMGEVAGFNLVPMAIAGLQQVLQWQVPYIQDELKKLTARINEYKAAQGMINEHFISVGHIANIAISKEKIPALKQRLQDNRTVISFRGASIRVSPHLYNSAADMEKLLSCL